MNYTPPSQTQQQVNKNTSPSKLVKQVVSALEKGITGTEGKDISPEGTDLHGWLLESLQLCESSSSERVWRESAKRDFGFYAGHQDDQEVLDKLREDKRPASVFNEIKPKVDMVVGLAAQGRREPEVLPTGKEDEGLAEVMNGVMKHFRTKLKISRKEVEVFDDVVKGGRGFLHFHLDDENPFKPELEVTKINPRSVWIDPESTAYDLSDAAYMFVDKWLRQEEIWTRFPQLFPNPDGLGMPEGMEEFFNETTKKYRLVEAWYRKTVPVMWFMNPLSGKVEWARKTDFEKFVKVAEEGFDLPNGQQFQVEKGQLQGVLGFKKMTFYAIFTGSGILAKGANPYNHGKFPYVMCAGYKDDEYNAWFGAIATMTDPQMTLNTMRRQLVHLLQTSPRGILMHEVGAILNIEEYEQKSAHPTYHMELAPNGIEKVKFSNQPTISPVYSQQDEVMTQAMKNASGIQDSLMGMQTGTREPGVTVKMRQDTGVAVLYMLFDNYREFRLACGEMLLSMTQQYVDYEMVVRIEGEQGRQLLEVNTTPYNDITAAEFDLVMDETPESPSQRTGTAQLLVDLNHNNPGVIPPQMILDYAGLPFSARREIQQYQDHQAKAQSDAQQAQWDHETRLALIKARVTQAIAEDNNQTKKEIEDGKRQQQQREHERGQEQGPARGGNGNGDNGNRRKRREVR